MGTQLDLDDVCAGHPLAQQQLADLRDQRWHEYAAAAMAGLNVTQQGWEIAADILAHLSARQADAMMALIAARAGEGRG